MQPPFFRMIHLYRLQKCSRFPSCGQTRVFTIFGHERIQFEEERDIYFLISCDG